MRRIDFTTALTLVGLLACLGLSGWWFSLSTGLVLAKERWDDTRTQLPLIEARIKSINEMKKEVAWTSDERERALSDPKNYVERQFGKAQISSSDFIIDEKRNIQVSFKVKGRTKRAVDSELIIRFKKKRNSTTAYTRNQIYAAVKNMESQSNHWKLRHIKLVNEDVRGRKTKKKGYPDVLSDSWTVDKLVFVRREPDVKKRRK